MTARRWLVSAAIFAACASAACAPAAPAERNDLSDLPPLASPEPASDPLANLPATFKGELPCPDCPGVRYHLNLFPDQTYNLRVETVGRADGTKDDLGGWVLSSDRRAVVLKGSRGTEFFGLASGAALRKLDADAREIDTSKQYDLKRGTRFEPIDVALALRGAYVYMADSGSFTECSTGRRWPVAAEGANAELERAYLAARPATGQAVVMSVEGRIAPRTRLDGTGTRPTLIVDRVIGSVSNQTCGQRYSSLPFEGTDWKLVRVGSKPVSGRASLTLDPSQLNYAGSGGCNQIAGSYERNGALVTFTAAINERRTCPTGMDVDQEFRAALTETRRWRVLGAILELQDSGGKMLARLEGER